METQGVTASELRVHFKDLANDIARGGAPAVISRHGFNMVALISYEDFLLLEQIKREQKKAHGRSAVPPHPELMELAEVERVYRETEGTTDLDMVDWRFKAFFVLHAWKSPLAPGPYPWSKAKAQTDTSSPPS